MSDTDWLDDLFPNLRAWHDKHGDLHTIAETKNIVTEKLMSARIDELEDLLKRVTPPRDSFGIISGSMVRGYLIDRIKALQASKEGK